MSTPFRNATPSRALLLLVAAGLWLLPFLPLAVAPAAAERLAGPAVSAGAVPFLVISAHASEAGIDRTFRHLQNRAERSLERLRHSLSDAGALWLWLLFSTAAFLLTASVASAADLRMFELRRLRLNAVLTDLVTGMRVFFGVLRDRRTPWLPRFLLGAGLLYWLVPVDLISDSPALPGVVDDLLVAFAGAKTFMYFCPDTLVSRHARAVAARQHA